MTCHVSSYLLTEIMDINVAFSMTQVFSGSKKSAVGRGPMFAFRIQMSHLRVARPTVLTDSLPHPPNYKNVRLRVSALVPHLSLI